jgi:hypothetical protein
MQSVTIATDLMVSEFPLSTIGCTTEFDDGKQLDLVNNGFL